MIIKTGVHSAAHILEGELIIHIYYYLDRVKNIFTTHCTFAWEEKAVIYTQIYI